MKFPNKKASENLTYFRKIPVEFRVFVILSVDVNIIPEIRLKILEKYTKKFQPPLRTILKKFT